MSQHEYGPKQFKGKGTPKKNAAASFTPIRGPKAGQCIEEKNGHWKVDEKGKSENLMETIHNRISWDDVASEGEGGSRKRFRGSSGGGKCRGRVGKDKGGLRGEGGGRGER